MSNRLAHESSPYLLQHANNPVDWFPWNQEALEKSRSEDKPIFLSIGYSACHWCHVMEHESFEDKNIAGMLNENFVSIKVDREERPDLDHIYMNAVMALRQGGGGWPLSVFLTPEQEVFFGGTYWPPTERMGMPGFGHVLTRVLEAFRTRRDEVTAQSKQITSWLNQSDEESNDPKLNSRMLADSAIALERNFDFQNGGFGQAPKFPHAMDLSLLVRLARRWPSDATPTADTMIEMVKTNLKKMAYGGIFDHLAGGFARYSVDAQWLVPHFEKMLYDNALLANAYLDMFQHSGERFYSMIARKTLNYVLENLTDNSGGFQSTEDADSEGVEGKFYVWSKSEIIEQLGPETGERFCDLYNVTENGNFEGTNILNVTRSYQEFADHHSVPKQQLREEMRDARKTLLKYRDQRIRPGKDDKIIVSWNGLAIAAMARAAVLLNDSSYHSAAANAANFILSTLRRDDGRLLHTWRDGTAKLDAYLDDYAYLIVALIELHQSDFDERWIDEAILLTESMIRHFGDENGFYFTADDHEKLIARTKSFQDSSVPSGNSMAALALARLGRLTGRTEWVARATATANGAVSLIQRSPLASGQMLIAIQDLLDKPCEIVLVVDTIDDDAIKLSNRLSRLVLDNHVVLRRSHDQAYNSPNLDSVLAGKTVIDSQPTLYICQGFSCAAPVLGKEEIEKAIAQLKGQTIAFES